MGLSLGTLTGLAQAPVSAADEVSASADTDIVINEVFYRSAGADDDWIELKNVGSSPIDISG